MSKLTVVHANELIEASYSLQINEIRLLALACTKFNSKNDSPAHVADIKIYVKDFIAAYSVENKNIYAELRDAVKSIMRKPIKLYNNETSMLEEYSWLTKNSYSKTDGSHVVLRFSPLIEPYLFELSSRFTSIKFEYISKLNTPFSFRLYQWLYRSKNMNCAKVGATTVVQLDIDWMKSQAGLQDRHSTWCKFRDKVLVPAVNKINSVTDLSVVLSPIKAGRKVVSIEFTYVVENATLTRPVRPRLYRRPRVIEGSHAEGEWMRKNEQLLLDYEKKLKTYDPNLQLGLTDLRRLIEIYKAKGETESFHEHYQQRLCELANRSKKQS